jgi:hypothetical protein
MNHFVNPLPHPIQSLGKRTWNRFDDLNLSKPLELLSFYRTNLMICKIFIFLWNNCGKNSLFVYTKKDHNISIQEKASFFAKNGNNLTKMVIICIIDPPIRGRRTSLIRRSSSSRRRRPRTSWARTCASWTSGPPQVNIVLCHVDRFFKNVNQGTGESPLNRPVY